MWRSCRGKTRLSLSVVAHRCWQISGCKPFFLQSGCHFSLPYLPQSPMYRFPYVHLLRQLNELLDNCCDQGKMVHDISVQFDSAYLYTSAWQKSFKDTSGNNFASVQRTTRRQCVVINRLLGLVRLPAILCLSIQGIIDSPQVQTSRLTVINHAVPDLIMARIAPTMTRNLAAFDTRRFCTTILIPSFAKYQSDEINSSDKRERGR